MSSELFKLYRR